MKLFFMAFIIGILFSKITFADILKSFQPYNGTYDIVSCEPTDEYTVRQLLTGKLTISGNEQWARIATAPEGEVANFSRYYSTIERWGPRYKEIRGWRDLDDPRLFPPGSSEVSWFTTNILQARRTFVEHTYLFKRDGQTVFKLAYLSRSGDFEIECILKPTDF